MPRHAPAWLLLLIGVGCEAPEPVARPTTWKLERLLTGHERNIRRLAFSPNGDLLASSSEEGQVRLWNPDTGELKSTFAAHAETVMALAFSPDGKRLATGSFDTRVRTWELSSGRKLLDLSPGLGEVYEVAFSPDGRFIGAVADNAKTGVWEATTGDLHFAPPMPLTAATGIAFSPDGTQVAVAGNAETVKLFDLATRRLVWELGGHARFTMKTIAYGASGDRLYVRDKEGLRVWDPRRGVELAHDFISSGRFLDFAVSRDGGTVVTCDTTGSVAIRGLRSLGAVMLPSDTIGTTCLALSPDGRRLATAKDNVISLWSR